MLQKRASSYGEYIERCNMFQTDVQVRHSYGVHTASMRTTKFLLDTNTDINPVKPTLLPLQYTNRIKREKWLIFALKHKNQSTSMERYSSTSISETYELENGSILFIILPSVRYLAPLSLISLYADSSQSNEKLSRSTLTRMQSTQPRNVISRYVRAHNMLLRFLANRLTTTRLRHTKFLSHDIRYSNRTATTAS